MVSSKHFFRVFHCIRDLPRSYGEIKVKLDMGSQEKQLMNELNKLWKLDLIMRVYVGALDVKWRYQVTNKGKELEELVELLLKLYPALGGK